MDFLVQLSEQYTLRTNNPAKHSHLFSAKVSKANKYLQVSQGHLVNY